MSDRDGRRDDRGKEGAGDADLRWDQPEQSRRREQRERHDGQADGKQHMSEDSLDPQEGQLPEGDRGDAATEADQDAHRLGDPAAAEGEAQEERGAERQRDAADDGEHATLEPGLDGGAGRLLAILGRRQAEAFKEAAASAEGPLGATTVAGRVRMPIAALRPVGLGCGGRASGAAGTGGATWAGFGSHGRRGDLGRSAAWGGRAP